MADQPGFQIEGRFYPFVQQYKHGDPILIHEVTGLSWDEFAELLAESAEDGATPNPIVQTALIAVAIQREFPTWNRRRVSNYVRNLELGSEEVVGTDETPVPGDVDGEGAVTRIPPSVSDESSSNSDETLEPSLESLTEDKSVISSPSSSGDPGSDITSPESLRVA